MGRRCRAWVKSASIGLKWRRGCQPGAGPPRAEAAYRNMHYVYIIRSEQDGKLYKGSTGDLKRRFKEHNNGKVLSTKSRMPWQLIYYEAFLEKNDTLREEIFLKSGKGRERIKYLFKHGNVE